MSYMYICNLSNAGHMPTQCAGHLHLLSRLMGVTVLGRRYYYLHFINVGTEVQRV